MSGRIRGPVAALFTSLLAACAALPSSTPQTRREAQVTTAKASAQIEAQAIAFESYMRRARAIDPAFANPTDVSAALQTGASHDPVQLEAGMVAYAAEAALRDPAFVAGVRRAPGRSDIARRISADPALALALPGAEAAAARASAALARQGEALADTGLRVKKASYTIQRQAWSKARVPDASGRLARVKRLSSVAYRAEPGDAARLQQALAQGGGRAGRPSLIVARGVALAALSALGEDGMGRSLMSEPRSASCLRMAKLNLYQCLASAGPHYEDVYCLGQHALYDPGQCVADASRAAAPAAKATRASYRR